MMINFASRLFLSCALLTGRSWAGEEEFNQLQYKLEADVLELRSMVEEAYKERCNPSTLQSCHRSSYDACTSAFPNPVCPSSDEVAFDVCVEGCGSVWDYGISNAYFPPFPGSRDDPAVVEDLCYSGLVDEYFAEKREQDRVFWEGYGIESPDMHIGMSSGAFRFYPARANETCNAYDPRVRPWYVAGSSGPKNVVLMLDVSGSMDGIRLYFLKQAAIRIIDTLTIGDRIAVVPFSTNAQVEYFDGEALVKVTSSIKNELKKRINELEAVGATNFYDVFDSVFKVMKASIPKEKIVNCNTALIFLTDGEMTDPPEKTESDVLVDVEKGLADLQSVLRHPVYLFTYSISENDDVHAFPKQLACQTTDKGIWSKVIDERTIIESLSSYTNLFSMGLGEGRNDDFVAWVEPYIFSTRGEYGVTISAPFFDRSVTPPVLVGVVGYDFLVEALDRALGCDMENFRAFGIAGEEARCGVSNCTASEEFSLTVSVCSNQDDLPANILANADSRDKSFIERACCTPSPKGGGTYAPLEDLESDTCVARSLASQTKDLPIAAIAGGAAGGLVFLLAIVGGCILMRRKRESKNQEDSKAGQQKANSTMMEQSSATSSSPPPTAPEEYQVPAAIGRPIPVPAEASAPNTYRIEIGGGK
ncbi:MAG: hypothetical protein SGILL_003564 [Bacillariaceae sp.]